MPAADLVITGTVLTVDGGATLAGERRFRRDIDDRPAAGFQMRDAVMRHHVVMDQVFFQRLHEGGAAGMESGAVVDAGVIDQSIELSERLHGLRNGLPAFVFVHQIELENARFILRREQARPEFRPGVAFAENDRNRAFSCKLQRNGGADARAAAGHDHYFVFQM